MRGTALLALLVGGAVVFGVGCGKKEEAAPTPAAAVDPNSTGVAECDAYLKAMTDCYAGTPQAKQTEASMGMLREKLKADVGAKGKDVVKADCVQHSNLLQKNPACAKK